MEAPTESSGMVVGQQGHIIACAGEAVVMLDVVNDDIKRVRVGGKAAKVIEGLI